MDLDAGGGGGAARAGGGADRAARGGGDGAVLAAVAPRRRVGAAEPDVGAPPAGRQGECLGRRAGRGEVHGERAHAPRQPVGVGRLVRRVDGEAARVDAKRARRPPARRHAAIEQAEAALAGIVPSAPLNVRPRSSPNRRPPAMLDLDAEGGGEAHLRRCGGARERAQLQRRQRTAERAARPRRRRGRRAHRGLPPPLRRRRRARRRRGGRQLSRKLSFTGDAPPAGRADAVAADAEAAERAALG